MSYDYDALVSEFITKRQEAATNDDDDDDRAPPRAAAADLLQQAVQALETLSSHCPMAPVLWIQYAAALADCLRAMGADAATVRQSRRDALALGLAEFPGSLLLQCRHVQACLEDEKHDNDGDGNLVERALETAIAQVGKGSYRKADPLVAWLYRKLADQRRRTNPGNLEAAYQVFFEQALVPLAHANEALQHTVQTWVGEDTQVPPAVLTALETGRRLVAKVFTAAAPDAQADEEVEAQLNQAGILDHPHIVWNADGDIDWSAVEMPAGQRYGMGYGDASLAKAFVSYAEACTRQPVIDDDDDPGLQALQDYKRKSLPWSIYERGVAECPTVESLWLSYIKELRQRGSREQRQKQLPSIIQRACRNCPYSIVLVLQDLENTQQLAAEGLADCEPDVLLQRVQAAWDRQFLPGGPTTWCDLMLQAVSAVRQNLLSLCHPNYHQDDKKKLSQKIKIDDESLDEIDDLREDVSGLYVTLLDKLHEKFPEYVAGRSRMLQEQALVEYHLLRPLETETRPATSQGDFDAAERLAKATQIHRHPDTYLTWIHFIQYNKTVHGDKLSNATRIVQGLAQIRLAFVQAWQQVSSKAAGRRDFQTALADLAHEWIQWETLFGNTASLHRAQSAVQKKYRRLQEQQQTEQKKQERHNKERDRGRAKRKIEETESEDPGGKRVKRLKPEDTQPSRAVAAPAADSSADVKEASVGQQRSDGGSGVEKAETTKAGAKQSKTALPKVTINGMEYPAHPFTVRVSNLAPEVEDMDLVDLLRPKCGAVVHSRIVREKGHGKTKSKGWGFVQFEEKDAVDKALALSEEIGLHQRLVTIDRSNTPAVLLVPPGMHRIMPQGEGRSSKRNEKRKGKTDSERSPSGSAENVAERKPSAPQPSVLSLAPRGVLKKASRPKPKLRVSP